MNRRPQSREDKGAPKWMVTFSDLMTLILVFFIMLFSMSVVDANKFRAIAESFQDRAVFDGFPSVIPFENPSDNAEVNDDTDESPDPFEETTDPFEAYIDEDEEKMNQELDNLMDDVNEFLEVNELTEEISASRDDRGVVLVLQEQALFESAAAEIIPDAYPFLDKVGTLLDTIPNMVKVEGHTDSRPISTAQFPSNWELSGARASSIIRYLVDSESLAPERFLAVGYGDTRPVVPNTTVDNLQQNRRIVIVISDPNYGDEDLY
ncbi:flagellar motor protein MotS [Salipaludibacillus neizhouensis]|uniref:Flagellar motor protein MotS n=1 Tax=Salipaludibacillus neizhouensis TaxID=885475 RepID=A0A3A9K7C8_9BACI|nr:flagellar motor protein MotS [Salipaludibacillus neizhouensis]RKL66750.1 flagellar motor protein MotS [Salipaludibacillus neizhouensis]